MVRYETHLHTFPVSRCGKADVRENLLFYRSLGYDGVFITNHFLDGNIDIDRNRSYQEKLEFYFSDYDLAKSMEQELGIRVFFGTELSYRGTDFLIYNLSPAWYRAHSEIMEMEKKEELAFMMAEGALVIQAHPYREANYIDHIRLFPRSVHGVEVLNANRNELENQMAEIYGKKYDLLPFAGTDNHVGAGQKKLAGMAFETPIEDEGDFARRILQGEGEIFSLLLP